MNDRTKRILGLILAVILLLAGMALIFISFTELIPDNTPKHTVRKAVSYFGILAIIIGAAEYCYCKPWSLK